MATVNLDLDLSLNEYLADVARNIAYSRHPELRPDEAEGWFLEKESFAFGDYYFTFANDYGDMQVRVPLQNVLRVILAD